MDIYAHEPLGFDGILVHVEADIRTGIPAVEIVGLASTSVREARERARIAMRNAGFEFPQDRILVNLSPADLPKEGSAYDLPIALKILAKSGQVEDVPARILAMGELTLEGDIRSARGVLPAVRAAAGHGIRSCILPYENAGEAHIVSSVQVWPVRHLSEARQVLIALGKGEAPQRSGRTTIDRVPDQIQDFDDFRGDERLMRALMVAAAGGHNMFLAGPPGAGKTMAAQRFPSILPELDEEEAFDTASLYSLWGKTQVQLMRRPPFRAPHHSASLEGMLGGSRPLRPGEVSLAHHGVLFLDECPEFRRDVLQALREPVEQGYVDIVRAGRVLRFPSDFQLIMAANPCPCGNLGMPGKTCLCSPEEIRRYWKKLGGPLMDRIDMRIAVTPPEPSRLIRASVTPTSLFREKVLSARLHQRSRLKRACATYGNPRTNARIPPALISDICSIKGSAEKLFLSGMTSYGLSARAGHSILKVARTIADLDARTDIGESAIEEAMEYRQFGDGDALWPI
ncbi:MAG: YifB family Mg chelatase-like AAA ATPase [Rectinema sp.]